MNKAYNAIVSKLRDIARDRIRMEKIAGLRNKIFSRVNNITATENAIGNVKKEIAISSYQKSKVEDANPEAEEIRKGYDEDMKICEEEIKMLEESIKTDKEEVARLEGVIKGWENGTSKVSKDEMEEITKDLIKLVTNESARSLSSDLKASETSTS